MIKVDFDEKGIQAAERLMKLSPAEVSRGTIQAINRTLTRIGVLGAAEVRKRYSVKAGKVKKGHSLMPELHRDGYGEKRWQKDLRCL